MSDALLSSLLDIGSDVAAEPSNTIVESRYLLTLAAEAVVMTCPLSTLSANEGLRPPSERCTLWVVDEDCLSRASMKKDDDFTFRLSDFSCAYLTRCLSARCISRAAK